ncbi:MAG: hypothetical protein AVDCRST_MAG73-4286 [uncultured Thermomicrobiales bacterium]|uniref:Uncharacterized protein n=1 Tax=uncultured Thermomicrobiales bacterium TaxID=1645740 RepID=A0A6J4V559_9BACT|nr:MAG: hypothetical protein AVDCRST_MAG73-4286 [uncultured Thermomicrobiales bacterium]
MNARFAVVSAAVVYLIVQVAVLVVMANSVPGGFLLAR